MRAQTRQTLENIRAVLASFGGVMGDIVSLTHYVTDIGQFMATGDIRREFFAAPYPVTTTVEIAALYRPELVVRDHRHRRDPARPLPAAGGLMAPLTSAAPRTKPMMPRYGTGSTIGIQLFLSPA